MNCGLTLEGILPPIRCQDCNGGDSWDPKKMPSRGASRSGTCCAAPGCMAKRAKKILLVEDNDEVRELLALFMKHLGYNVFEAATGLEAIDQASTVEPDLILMDLRLPG